MAKHFLTDRDQEVLAEMVRDYKSGAFFGSTYRPTRKQLPAIQEVSIGKTAEVISPNGFGDVTRWTVTSDAFAAVTPTDTVVAYDWLGKGIATDTAVSLLRVQHGEGTRWIAITTGESVLRMVEITTTLALGDTADAEFLEWTGTEWDTNSSAVTIYDGLGRFSGVVGDKFWVTLSAESGRWEVVSPGEGSGGDLRMDWCSMQGAATTSTSSGAMNPVLYTGGQTSAAEAVCTFDHTTGRITVAEDGYVSINFAANLHPDTAYGAGTIDIWRIRLHNDPGSTVHSVYIPVDMDEAAVGAPLSFHWAGALPNGGSAPIDLYISLLNTSSSAREGQMLGNSIFHVAWTNRTDAT